MRPISLMFGAFLLICALAGVMPTAVQAQSIEGYTSCQSLYNGMWQCWNTSRDKTLMTTEQYAARWRRAERKQLVPVPPAPPAPPAAVAPPVATPPAPEPPKLPPPSVMPPPPGDLKVLTPPEPPAVAEAPKAAAPEAPQITGDEDKKSCAALPVDKTLVRGYKWLEAGEKVLGRQIVVPDQKNQRNPEHLLPFGTYNYVGPRKNHFNPAPKDVPGGGKMLGVNFVEYMVQVGGCYELQYYGPPVIMEKAE